jgi:hypothetical protein
MLLTARDCVMVFDFGDGRKRNFYDLTVGALHFDAGGRQGLSGFHTPNGSPDSPPVDRNDLYVVFAVQGL